MAYVKKNKPKTKLGPYGMLNAEGKPCLTAEGQRFLTEWMEAWPPGKLLWKLCRGYANAAKTIGADDEELKALAAQACAQSMLTWDPDVAGFSTYAGRNMRYAMMDFLRQRNAAGNWGVTVHSGLTFGDGEKEDLIAANIGHEDHSADDSDKKLQLKRKVAQALRTFPMPEREMFALLHGLRDGEEHTLHEIGAIFELSKERVRQITNRVREKIKPLLEDLLA
jgi:RNA polymerase sigma factor (sigma-70 family)